MIDRQIHPRISFARNTDARVQLVTPELQFGPEDRVNMIFEQSFRPVLTLETADLALEGDTVTARLTPEQTKRFQTGYFHVSLMYVISGEQGSTEWVLGYCHRSGTDGEVT